MIQIGEYTVKRPDEIETPAMLVFQDLMEHNIRSMIQIAGSPERVVSHFKTHKSADVLKQTIAAGIKAYKCSTLKEAEVLAENGAEEIIIAYPIPHPKKIRRLMELKKLYPDLNLRVIASQVQHLELLSEAAVAHGESLGVYVDLDAGMHRTGAQPGEEANQLFTRAANTPGLQLVGAHVYDGHTTHKANFEERKALADKTLHYIKDIWAHAGRQGLEISDTVAGGSWSFYFYVNEKSIRLSPGTWIYWDHMNGMMKELPFKVAATVLAQVVDQNVGEDTVTVDIGSKAISSDLLTPQRFKVLGHPSMELTAQSEEHGVIKRNGAVVNVGDYILASPGHACTTTPKYPHALVIDKGGEVIGRYEHTARDR